MDVTAPDGSPEGEPRRRVPTVREVLEHVSCRAMADPGRRGVAALAVVALLACLVAGWSAWRARPQAEPVDAVRVRAGASPLSGHGASASAPSSEVVVAVGGAVRRPGLVRLRTGARVADAVRAAGGIRPGTDTVGLNLARRVVDGELITVGPTRGAGAPAPGNPAPPGGQPGGALVDLNTATVAELDTLPGLGSVLAQRIVDYREQHGGFGTVEQLRDVDGIGDARFAELRDRVTV
jgi:competence protein ComEA